MQQVLGTVFTDEQTLHQVEGFAVVVVESDAFIGAVFFISAAHLWNLFVLCQTHLLCKLVRWNNTAIHLFCVLLLGVFSSGGGGGGETYPVYVNVMRGSVGMI